MRQVERSGGARKHWNPKPGTVGCEPATRASREQGSDQEWEPAAQQRQSDEGSAGEPPSFGLPGERSEFDRGVVSDILNRGLESWSGGLPAEAWNVASPCEWLT